MRSTRMRRFQIYLEPVTDAHLRRLSAKTGKPKAELVRDGINLLLEREAARMDEPLLDLIGLAGEAGYPEASEKHDDYLYTRERKERAKGKKQ
ncbi:MAG: ribbon-helix-helix domain-containing protein [Bacteroidota bacterium]